VALKMMRLLTRLEMEIKKRTPEPTWFATERAVKSRKMLRRAKGCKWLRGLEEHPRIDGVLGR
jgi:hypothetical protein